MRQLAGWCGAAGVDSLGDARVGEDRSGLAWKRNAGMSWPRMSRTEPVRSGFERKRLVRIGEARQATLVMAGSG